MKISTVTLILSALAQESRLLIYRTLIQAGPSGMSAGKISDMTGIAPSSLSFHLKELYQANLITVERQGRNLIYRPNPGMVEDLSEFLLANCCDGKPCKTTKIIKKVKAQ